MNKPQSGNRTRSSNIASIEQATKRSWTDWVRYFTEHDAAALPHPEIAQLALAQTPADLENPEWWAQGIAIAFEQHAGLRVPGQASDGTFRVGVSRTLTLDRDTAIELWITAHGATAHHRGHAASAPRQSRTEKRTFWRIDLANAGRVEVAAAEKDGERSILSIEHTQIATAKLIEPWRTHWKSLIAEL